MCTTEITQTTLEGFGRKEANKGIRTPERNLPPKEELPPSKRRVSFCHILSMMKKSSSG